VQKVTVRRGPGLAFVNNDRSEFNLPNVDRWHRIWLRFTGTMTIVLGGGTAAVTAEAPFSVMRQIRLTLQGYRGLGNTVLYALSGFQAAVYARVENPNYTDNNVQPVAAGANAWSFNLLLPISVGETDFAGMLTLAGDKSATLILSIDWGNVNLAANGTSDAVVLAAGAANSATLTGTATMVSETFQFLKGEAERLGIREDIIHQISAKRDNIVAIGNLPVDLTVGVLYVRLIYLVRNNGVFANSVFDLFELVVEDSVRPYSLNEDQWRGQTRYRNLSDYPTGVYAQDRYWTRTWRDVYDASALTRLQASFNIIAAVTAPADVSTIREVAIPTPAAARKAA
jgi:hypothetical protein